MRHILIHYNEIALKGGNRPYFERKLQDNIRMAMKNAGIVAKITRLTGRIVAELNDAEQMPLALEAMNCIFGVSSYSPAYLVETNEKNIFDAATEVMKPLTTSTFKVETERSWKPFPKNSMEISRELGALILQKFPHLKVDVKKPETVLRIELMKESTFVYAQKLRGLGGMPVGSAGRVLCLISGGIDSPVAAFMMMKRGCAVDFVHFHSYPQTDKASIEKVQELIKILQKFQPIIRPRIYLVPILDFQKEVLKTSDARLRIVLYRRMMYRLAEKLAAENGDLALISGDSLAQVASQTIENMAVIGKGMKLPIFRPLLSFDKEEIIAIAQKIGTFEISIEPHGDCCSVFMPKNPATGARWTDVAAEEKKLTKAIRATMKAADRLKS
jgi:thiamine biosynthesis protein ThiI